ncbi:hypothetical protein ACC862_24115 [Rhizobium ruizarguesonis]
MDTVAGLLANPTIQAAVGLFSAVISIVAGILLPRYYHHFSRRSFKEKVIDRAANLDLIFSMKVTNDLAPFLIARAMVVILRALLCLTALIVSYILVTPTFSFSTILGLALFASFTVNLYRVTAQARLLIDMSHASFRADRQVEELRRFYKQSSLYQYLDEEDRAIIERRIGSVEAFAKVLDGEHRASLFSRWGAGPMPEENISEAIADLKTKQADLAEALVASTQVIESLKEFAYELRAELKAGFDSDGKPKSS